MTDSLDIFIFNPLPWEREIQGPVSRHVTSPRGVVADETAGRHFQDRDIGHERLAGLEDGEPTLYGTDASLLPPTSVPGYGYTVIPQGELVETGEWATSGQATVETDRYEITFDRERGGIREWQDKELGCDWVDDDADYPLGGFVHEEVANKSRDAPRRLLFDYPPSVEDWHAAVAGISDSPRGFRPDWHANRQVTRGVKRHLVYESPLGYEVRQTLDVPDVESDVSLRIFVPNEDATVVVEAEWVMGLETHPEATYLAFPFDLPDPTATIDVGGQAVEPGRDQLEGTVYDYYTVQRWSDLSNEDRGMTIGCPLNPMVQFGDFHFGGDQNKFDLERALFLGWVTNNYWDTNFRAHQPGKVSARYHLTPHRGPFDESFAHRKGLEAEHTMPLAQTMGESSTDPQLQACGSLLDLPEPPTLILQIRPEEEDAGVFHPGSSTPEIGDAILVLLKNAADEPTVTSIDSSQLRIESAERANPLNGHARSSISVEDEAVSVELEGRETTMVRLEVDYR